MPVQLIERLRNYWHMYWHMTTLFLKGIVTHHSAFGIDWLCSLTGGNQHKFQMSLAKLWMMHYHLVISVQQEIFIELSENSCCWVIFFFFQTNPCSLCNYRVKKCIYTDSHWTILVVYCWSYARKPFFQCHCLS